MYIELYGSHAISANVHNLIHVVENVDRFGILSSISTYEFENNARVMKLQIKQCNKSIEQAARRISETSMFNENKETEIPQGVCSLKYPSDRLSNYNTVAYQYISFKNIIFSSRKRGDEWFLTKTNDIIKFNFVVKSNDELFICGSPLKEKKDAFTKPFKSSFIDIYASQLLFDTDKSY